MQAEGQELARQLPQAIDNLESRVAHVAWLRDAIDSLPSATALAPRSDVLGRITGFFSTTAGALAGLFIVLVAGVYLAVDPALYVRGLAHLFPAGRRSRVKAVLHETGSTLGWWLAGKFASMSIIGVLTALGLWLLGVPLPLPLAVIAALLTFIPNFGPLISLVPAALLALLQDPMLALYVILLYGAIQFVESYLVTPLIQQRMVSLPPALTLVVQVFAGVFAGAMGLVLATPMAVAAMVLVRRLYIEGVLGDEQDGLAPGTHGRSGAGETRRREAS